MRKSVESQTVRFYFDSYSLISQTPVLKVSIYADDTVLIANTNKKLQDLLDNVVKERVRKGLRINSKKRECMITSKSSNPRC